MTATNSTIEYDGIVELLEMRQTNNGSLSGLSFAIKDMFDVKGRVSGFGNPDWKATHKPAAGNAPVLDQLLGAAAKLVAVACCDELACSLDGINIHFGTPVNSQAPNCIPGGSSSGSASLVSAGQVDFAIGTDTAGSVRVPASYCGIFGLRPTHASIAIAGVLALGPSFDTVGILASSIEVVNRVAEVLIKSGPDRNLPTKLILPSNFTGPLNKSIASHMVAHAELVTKHFRSVRSADLYAKSEEVYEVFRVVRAREAWSIHGQWFESVHPKMAPGIGKRLTQCKFITDEEYERALQKRAELMAHIDEIIDTDSVICLPTTWTMPPLKTASEQELQDNRNRNLCLTALSSFYGFPQINIPVSAGSQKLGLSLIGARGTDLALLALAQQISEDITNK